MTEPGTYTSQTSSIERVTVEASMTFEALVRAFEAQLGTYDHGVGEDLVARQANWKETSETIEAMRGPHGLMSFFSLDLGATASLKDVQRQCRLYLVGNPLIATEIVANDMRAGMLVPFRVQIYTTGDRVFLSYDRPSSSLGSLANEAIDTIGASLDEKMDGLLMAVLGHNA